VAECRCLGQVSRPFCELSERALPRPVGEAHGIALAAVLRLAPLRVVRQTRHIADSLVLHPQVLPDAVLDAFRQPGGVGPGIEQVEWICPRSLCLDATLKGFSPDHQEPNMFVTPVQPGSLLLIVLRA